MLRQPRVGVLPLAAVAITSHPAANRKGHFESLLSRRTHDEIQWYDEAGIERQMAKLLAHCALQAGCCLTVCATSSCVQIGINIPSVSITSKSKCGLVDPPLLIFVSYREIEKMSQSNDSFVHPGDDDRRIAAPFEDWSSEDMKKEIEEFIKVSGLDDEKDYIERGARLARDKKAFLRKHNPLQLRPDKRERHYLDIEINSSRKCRFNQTWTLYAVVIVCSLGAAVQGWDESAVSGGKLDHFASSSKADNLRRTALISYQFSLDIWRNSDAYYLGLVNAAPYLCCTFACWLVSCARRPKKKNS